MQTAHIKTAYVLALIVVPCWTERNHGQDIRFSRDILPVLSDRCFHCHGPDENNREADLRLDLEEAAKRDLGGYQPISPGSLEHSEIWQRVISEDEDLRMPPPDSHRKPLTQRELAALRKWIEQGAEWGEHWAFERPQRPQVPAVADHPVDAFIQQRLADQGLSPSPSAAPGWASSTRPSSGHR